jgi:hypothetical protein
MRKFVNTLPTKEIKFMGDKIKIKKLTAGAVKRIGEASKKVQDSNDEDATLKILIKIFEEGIVIEDSEEKITVELLEEFPLDELNNLSIEIMEFGGVPVGADAEGNVV